MRNLLILVLSLLAGFQAGASEIAVAPLRRVITADAPSATFRISNPTDRILEARVSWVDLAAGSEGYESISAKQRAQLSAAPYLVLRPAFLRIEPGGSADVTVALKRGAAPPTGERRSHVLVESGAARTPLRKTSGLELDIGLGISTPVILRGGKGEAAAKIGATRFLRSPEGLLLLETTIEPAGIFSAYGRLIAEYLPLDGEPTRLGEIRNVSAYIDAKRRVYTIPLNVRELPAGKLRLAFLGAEEFNGRSFATREFSVGAASD